MNIITNKMTKWLKAFAIIFNILAIFNGMGFVGGAFAFLLFACNKNIYTYDLGEGNTIASLFDEMGIASRKELLALLGASVISLAISLAVFILLAKWFKKAYTTSDPFSTDLVQFLKKIAKFMLIASISGFIIEAIIETATDTSFNLSYKTIFFGGLLAMCISYVLAYANVSRKVAQIEDESALASSTPIVVDTNNDSKMTDNEVEATNNSADQIETASADNQTTEVEPKTPRKRASSKRSTTSKTTSTTRKRTTSPATKDNTDTKTTRKRTTKQSSNAKSSSKNSNNNKTE